MHRHIPQGQTFCITIDNVTDDEGNSINLSSYEAIVLLCVYPDEDAIIFSSTATQPGSTLIVRDPSGSLKINVDESLSKRLATGRLILEAKIIDKATGRSSIRSKYICNIVECVMTQREIMNFNISIDGAPSEKLDKTGDASSVVVSFVPAEVRGNIETGKRLSATLGQLSKWFVDLFDINGKINASLLPLNQSWDDISGWDYAKAGNHPMLATYMGINSKIIPLKQGATLQSGDLIMLEFAYEYGLSSAEGNDFDSILNRETVVHTCGFEAGKYPQLSQQTLFRKEFLLSEAGLYNYSLTLKLTSAPNKGATITCSLIGLGSFSLELIRIWKLKE